MKSSKLVPSFLAALLTIFLTSLPAQAHKLRVFAYMEGNEIVAETAFSGGNPAKGATIMALDEATQKELASGTTQEDGTWHCTLPQAAQQAKQGIRIVANVGDGHKGDWLLEANEYLVSAQQKVQTSEQQNVATSAEPQIKPVESSKKETNPTSPTVSVSLSEAELSKLLDQKLASIKRQLHELEDPAPRFKDIVGGIGFIVGIAGIVAYLRSRRK